MSSMRTIIRSSMSCMRSTIGSHMSSTRSIRSITRSSTRSMSCMNSIMNGTFVIDWQQNCRKCQWCLEIWENPLFLKTYLHAPYSNSDILLQPEVLINSRLPTLTFYKALHVQLGYSKPSQMQLQFN